MLFWLTSRVLFLTWVQWCRRGLRGVSVHQHSAGWSFHPVVALYNHVKATLYKSCYEVFFFFLCFAFSILVLMQRWRQVQHLSLNFISQSSQQQLKATLRFALLLALSFSPSKPVLSFCVCDGISTDCSVWFHHTLVFILAHSQCFPPSLPPGNPNVMF